MKKIVLLPLDINYLLETTHMLTFMIFKGHNSTIVLFVDAHFSLARSTGPSGVLEVSGEAVFAYRTNVEDLKASAVGYSLHTKYATLDRLSGQ